MTSTQYSSQFSETYVTREPTPSLKLELLPGGLAQHGNDESRFRSTLQFGGRQDDK